MKYIRLTRWMSSPDGLKQGKCYILNHESIVNITEDCLYDPVNNGYITVTNLSFKDGTNIYVEEDGTAVLEELFLRHV